jgi:pimeloyl-ACP methyl ester carboxylesterase
VVLLHGSNESARSHTQLALALAGAFTVYLPDRRGRGLSGPHRPGHRMRTEIEDLRAVVAGSGAQKVFGVSVSALIAPQAAAGQAGDEVEVLGPGTAQDGEGERGGAVQAVVGAVHYEPHPVPSAQNFPMISFSGP